MFRFHRGLPNISIFHHPSSTQSQQALALLRSSLSSSYPPNAKPPRPLEFNLEVVENPPTPDQFSTILSYKSAHPTTLSPSEDSQPATVESLRTLSSHNPNAIKFPVVVNWDDGQAAVGNLDDVRGILESLRRKRDGEEKQVDDVYHPKGWFS